jgi:hypothetical protein
MADRRPQLAGSGGDPGEELRIEGGEVLGVGVGKRTEVLLGGRDLSVTHAIHHGLDVGAAGEQPGRVAWRESWDTQNVFLCRESRG